MKKEEKQEKKEHVVATFGRFNPPTTGHLKLINHMKTLAQHHGADHIVFPSASHDNKKNPLGYREKLNFMHEMFPGTNIHKGAGVRDMLGMMKHLHKEGYKKATVVVGKDRLQEINNLLHKYNGKEYDFDHLSVVSGGDRDPDSGDVIGMSGSKMRTHAIDNNFKEFRKGVPQKQHARKLFNAVRKNMKTENYKCLFLIGGPGSGKDLLIRTILSEANIHEINLDKLHKAIVDKKDINEVNEGTSLIVNGNADDASKVLLSKQVLEAVGYKTSMVYVYTTDEVSKARNDARILAGSRTFNEEVRSEKYTKSFENLKSFEEGFDAFTIFNNSHDIQKIDEEKKEEVLGWMNELQDLLHGFFGVEKTSLDEEIQTLFSEDRRSEFGANQQLAQTHRMNTVKNNQNHYGSTGGSDYFSYQANKAVTKKTTNAGTKPVAAPLKPNTVSPTKHVAKEEVEGGFKTFAKKHKKSAKPPFVQSDVRAGDGMSATATLAAEENINELSKKTLGSYIQKAAPDMALAVRYSTTSDPEAKRILKNRKKGITKAAEKLSESIHHDRKSYEEAVGKNVKYLNHDGIECAYDYSGKKVGEWNSKTNTGLTGVLEPDYGFVNAPETNAAARTLSQVKESLATKSPDLEFSSPEVYEDWGVKGEEGIYEGRAVSLNKPFKTNKAYAVYVKDGDNVNRLDFSKKKSIIQEDLSTNDIRFWESK